MKKTILGLIAVAILATGVSAKSEAKITPEFRCDSRIKEIYSNKGRCRSYRFNLEGLSDYNCYKYYPNRVEQAFVASYEKMSAIRNCVPVTVNSDYARYLAKNRTTAEEDRRRNTVKKAQARHAAHRLKKFKRALSEVSNDTEVKIPLVGSGTIMKKKIDSNSNAVDYSLREDNTLKVTIYFDEGGTQEAEGTWKQEGRFIKMFITDYGEEGKYTFQESTIRLKDGLLNPSLWARGDTRDYTGYCTLGLTEKRVTPDRGKYECNYKVNNLNLQFTITEMGSKLGRWSASDKTGGLYKTDKKNRQLKLYPKDAPLDIDGAWGSKLVMTNTGYYLQFEGIPNRKYECVKITSSLFIVKFK